jgi:hypothetical protein
MSPWTTPTPTQNGILIFFNVRNNWLTSFLRNDILRKHGIIPEKPPSPTPIIEEAILEAQRKAHENRLEDKDLDELAALEDDEDEDFLEKYRFVYQSNRVKDILLTSSTRRRGRVDWTTAKNACKNSTACNKPASTALCTLCKRPTMLEKSLRRRRMATSCWCC